MFGKHASCGEVVITPSRVAPPCAASAPALSSTLTNTFNMLSAPDPRYRSVGILKRSICHPHHHAFLTSPAPLLVMSLRFSRRLSRPYWSAYADGSDHTGVSNKVRRMTQFNVIFESYCGDVRWSVKPQRETNALPL